MNQPIMPTNNILLVIPAFNPNTELLNLVSTLSKHPFSCLIVNDGSDTSSSSIFTTLDKMPCVTILHHTTNKGKGAALKTAFKYAMQQKIDYVITLDADGQHCAQDIEAIAVEACTHSDKLILGVRSFSKDVPLRSRFGNIVTKHILRLIGGVQLSDTQTGLRGLPLNFIKHAQHIPSDRYQFELECIFLAKSLHMQILEHPIQTIYIDDNATSHFRPLVDSLRIYWVFIRYSLASIASFLLDISIFSLLLPLTHHIIASTYIARAISSIFNYNINKRSVFQVERQESNITQSATYYFMLVLIIAFCSGFFVNLLANTSHNHNVTLIKILIDTSLFVMSFFIQRHYIFKKS